MALVTLVDVLIAVTKFSAVELSSPRVLLSQHCTGLAPIALHKELFSRAIAEDDFPKNLRFCNTDALSLSARDTSNEVVADLKICQ